MHSLPILISFINPPSVSGNNLVIECFTAISAYSHSGKYLRYNFAVIWAIFDLYPLEIVPLFLHLDLGVLPCLNLVHGSPRPPNGRCWVVYLRHPPDIPHSRLKMRDELWELLCNEVIHEVWPYQRGRPTLIWPHLTIKADVCGRIWCLSQFMMKRDGFRWWTLIGSDYLYVFKLVFLRSDNKVSHSGTSDILNLLQSRFVQNRGKFFSRLNIKILEHHSAIFWCSLNDLFVIFYEVLLNIHKIELFPVSWGQY